LLHAGSILSVVSFESEIYFLQVVSVQAVVASEGEAGAALKEGGFSSQVRSVALARATASTQYTIDENPRETTTTGIAGGPIDRQVLPGVCPQLPPLSEALSFLRPDQSSRLSVVPHPDVPRLAERFRLCAGARSLSMCAVSVVGTDRDHHVTAALHEAAAASGRRCVDAGHSWAAFGYLHCGGSSTTTAALAASGALPDKLRGLDAAAEVAVEHAPSVLVLRLDNELSSDRHDRQDQEDRVWSALSRMAQRNIDAWGVAGGVTVVLVSDETLDGGGPLAQRILAAPYASSHPDANYIRRLWNDPWRGLDQECVDLLRGRPAAEIERAFQLCKADGNFRPSDTKSILRLLKHCCEKVDQERRTRSNAQSRIPSVRWEDIGGLCHVRREIVEAIDLPLRYPHLLPEGRANLRTGLLLWGPPGTGKTLVAKAVATECSLPFVSVRGPELMGSYIGESEENVRNVFVSARRLASQNLPPAAVLFFDELDSLAPRRGDRSSGGNVTDRVVATLFAELERRVEGVKVFCMGATNRPDLLDPALLRPGRLDRLIYMGADASDHSRILHAQIRRLRLDGVAKEMASFLAKSLPANLTGADLSTIATASLVRATDRLCTEADGELARRQSEGDAVTLDEVLRSWDEDKLKPLVTLEDLVESANEVVPSVDANEILRYSSLRDSFLSN
jgi:peroxin-6